MPEFESFGGGFAQGFQGGTAAITNAVRTRQMGEEVKLRTAEAVQKRRSAIFKTSLDSLSFFQELADTAREQGASDPFAEGTQQRQLFDQAVELGKKTEKDAGFESGTFEAAAQTILTGSAIPQKFEASSAIGKLIQDRKEFQEGSEEFEKINQVIKAEIENNPDTITVQTRAPNGDQITLLVDKSSGATVAELGRGPSVQFQPTELPASKQQEVQERTDFLQQGIEQIDQALALPEGSFGSVATIGRGIREIMRVGGELTKAGVPEEVAAPLQALASLGERMIDGAIQEGRLDTETAAELLKSDLTEAQIIETHLAFLVANALQPTGRLLKDSIESARKIVNISGLFTSEKTARERLMTIRNILERSSGGLKGSAEVGEKRGEVKKRFRFNPATGELDPL